MYLKLDNSRRKTEKFIGCLIRNTGCAKAADYSTVVV
jgi:hypothetical protein